MKKLFYFFALSAIVLGMASCGDGNEPAIKGKFTVDNQGKQVYFSKGNLQASYDGSEWNWFFAKNQWDRIGAASGNIAIDSEGKIPANDTLDLFGWSTEATNYGINNSTDRNDYSGEFEDWGDNIGDGWRTLKVREWYYLIRQRPHAEDLFATGHIVMEDNSEVNGLIILPDDWQKTADVSFTPSTQCDDENIGKLVWDENYSRYFNSIKLNYSHNKYTLAEWLKMEKTGAIFLPTTGWRKNKSVSYVTLNGDYWASDADNDVQANYIYLTESTVKPASYADRYYGHAVRLVQDVK